MASSEKFRKAEKTEAAENDEKKVKGPQLNQIRANDEMSRLFGLHLDQIGQRELGERMRDNDVRPEDAEALKDARKSFLEIIESTKDIKGRLSGKDFEEIVESFPGLEKYIAMVGADGIKKAFVKNLERLAIKNPEQFNAIAEALRSADEAKKALQEIDKELATIYEKYGLKEDEYVEAMRDKDVLAVRNLIRESIGGFHFRSTIEKKIDDADSEAKFRQLNQEYDDRLRSIAETLHATIEGDDGEIYTAIMDDLNGIRPEKQKKEMSFGAMTKSLEFNEEEMKNEWLLYKASHENDAGFTEEQAMEEFIKETDEPRFKGQLGFWRNLGKTAWADLMKGLI